MIKPGTQWTVESVRCTAFPVQNANFDPANWWTDIVGGKPDQVTTQPIEGTYQAQGSKLGGVLQLLVQPLRIQWSLGPNPPDRQDQEWQIPNVGKFEQLSEFLQIAKNRLSVGPKLSRLAFGAVFLDVVENRESGYDRLDQFLPSVELESSKMRDFLYQVNRRRSSNAIEGIQINRLSKWSVAEISPMTIQIDAGQRGIKSSFGDPTSALRLELDINNVPSPEKFFDTDSAVKLLDELTEMGLEISESGDIQ
jgi:hypothetical protein